MMPQQYIYPITNNYYHKRTATKLGMELLHESQQENNNGEGRRNWKVSTSRGLESSDVITLGKHTPYNVAVAAALTRRSGSTNEDEINDNKKSKDGTDDYFEGVQKEFRSRRIRKQQQTTNDHVNDDGDDNEDYYRLWPLDKLRLELEEMHVKMIGRRNLQQKDNNNDDRLEADYHGL
jgi:hypothetical protein